MKNRFRILVIDSDRQRLEYQQAMLNEAGFQVVPAADAMSGLRAVYQTHPDAILLSVLLNEMDGLETCRRIRELTDIPILLLSPHPAQPEDVVQGFAAGADDYLSDPIREPELISRLLARLHRARRSEPSERDYLSPDALVILNAERHELIIEGRRVYLPPKEFEVLRVLLRRPGQVLSANAILAQIWGAERMGETELVKQYIYRLRKKIELDPRAPKYLLSVRGEGYYFQIPHLPDKAAS